ncbi:MAG: hypothetical protein Q8O03_02145 [Nanoarchaeota archaeon]|nr:hypothetical protein [Nanoarchaeota archaeon]
MGNNNLLSDTKAETAEERLEELVNNKSVTRFYVIFENQGYFYYDPKEGEARLYPDGFEAVIGGSEGLIYVDRRRTFVHYNLQKEREIQKEQGKD